MCSYDPKVNGLPFVLILIATLSLPSPPVFATGTVNIDSDLETCILAANDQFYPTSESALQSAIEVLNFGDTIPASVFEKYDSREIGEALVQWVRNREIANPLKGTLIELDAQFPKRHLFEILAADRPGYASNGDKIPRRRTFIPLDFRSQAQVVLQFFSTKLEEIEHEGFLNLHETGESLGTPDPGARRMIEDELLGLRFGVDNSKVWRVRPKSALVEISARVPIAEMGNEGFKYGDIGAVMKPRVKRRTLWVLNDSLEFGKKFRHTSKYQEALLNEFRGTFQRDKLQTAGESVRYYEGLIFGTVTLDDVDHFVVTEPATANRLKKYGIPIFLAQAERPQILPPLARAPEELNRFVRVYKSLLWKGNFIPQSVPLEEREKFREYLY